MGFSGDFSNDACEISNIAGRNECEWQSRGGQSSGHGQFKSAVSFKNNEIGLHAKQSIGNLDRAFLSGFHRPGFAGRPDRDRDTFSARFNTNKLTLRHSYPPAIGEVLFARSLPFRFADLEGLICSSEELSCRNSWNFSVSTQVV